MDEGKQRRRAAWTRQMDAALELRDPTAFRLRKMHTPLKKVPVQSPRHSFLLLRLPERKGFGSLRGLDGAGQSAVKRGICIEDLEQGGPSLVISLLLRLLFSLPPSFTLLLNRPVPPHPLPPSSSPSSYFSHPQLSPRSYLFPLQAFPFLPQLNLLEAFAAEPT